MPEQKAESREFTDLGPGAIGSPDAVAGLRQRIDAGRLESWLRSSRGRQLAVVSNGERATVMLLDGPDGPGGHTVDPGANGRSGGYLLANGQADEYPDEDTVPLDRALRLVRHLLDVGAPPPDAPCSYDC
ncbi:hypothetical protein ACIQF6_04240 [Kitasatospora sp. NPDC092948]|uniref:hypothetical protein n=1 Tax=Kitasatospora sp. NPDC092948 TaxID=3364088 RepID=UPI003830C818